MLNDNPTIALRLADDDDADVLLTLAALDGALPLKGQALLALVDGELVAALSLEDHRVIADPFMRSDDAVALLRLRAAHLRGQRTRRRHTLGRPWLRPRVVG
jgi:hypothetical protein